MSKEDSTSEQKCVTDNHPEKPWCLTHKRSLNKCSNNAAQDSSIPRTESPKTSELSAAPSGVQLIAAERERQITQEGWTPQHDDHHAQQELAQAAACYAWPAPRPIEVKKAWPWDFQWWKPTVFGVDADWREVSEARVRDLTKAGALLAAEIDRLHRLLNGQRTNTSASDGTTTTQG